MKILLVEDDEIISKFVQKGMKESGFTVDAFDNGIDGFNAAISGYYDIAVVDIMLPMMDGLTLIKEMRTRNISLPVIILSAKRSVDERINGLRHGSDDYLTKPFSFAELLARVEALLRRSNKVSESTTLSIQDLFMDLLARTVFRNGKKIDLQPKEFALLEYLARNQGRVISKTMIMERVWDYHFDPGTNVVEARISRLRDKVDKGFPVQLIHTVRGLGYVLKAD